MSGKNKFRNLTEVRLEMERLKLERDLNQDRLVQRWSAVQEPELRRMLLGNTVHNTMSSWGPYRILSGMLGVDRSGIGSLLGGALAARASTFKGRILALGVSALAPMIMERLISAERLEKIVTEFHVLWEQVKGLFNRKEADGE